VIALGKGQFHVSVYNGGLPGSRLGSFLHWANPR
jgi:hypothetical protein